MPYKLRTLIIMTISSIFISSCGQNEVEKQKSIYVKEVKEAIEIFYRYQNWSRHDFKVARYKYNIDIPKSAPSGAEYKEHVTKLVDIKNKYRKDGPYGNLFIGSEESTYRARQIHDSFSAFVDILLVYRNVNNEQLALIDKIDLSDEKGQEILIINTNKLVQIWYKLIVTDAYEKSEECLQNIVTAPTKLKWN